MHSFSKDLLNKEKQPEMATFCLMFLICFFAIAPQIAPQGNKKRFQQMLKLLINNGAPGTIRTCDTRLRRPLLDIVHKI